MSVDRSSPTVYVAIGVQRATVVKRARYLHEFFPMVTGVIQSALRVPVAAESAVRHHATEEPRAGGYLRVQPFDVHKVRWQVIGPTVHGLVDTESAVEALA